MIPQYQFNLGQADPLLNIAKGTPTDYIGNINQEIERLEQFKRQVTQLQQTNNKVSNKSVSLWDTIDSEVSSLTNEQKQILANDETYRNIDRELQMLIQQELVNSVKDIVEQSSKGKELLQAQLKNLRDKKSSIVAESNKEMELFKKFQIAVQANPNLTYAEFVKNIK